jgi:heptosyltransferase-2
VLSAPVRAKKKLALSRASRNTTLLPGRHHTDEFARILLGWTDSFRPESLPPVRPDRLPGSPLPSTEALRIALVPGGGRHLVREQSSGSLPQQVLRRWPIDRYVELARQLIDKGSEVVLLGSKDDSWVLEYFKQLRVTNCIGKLALPQVVSACDACDAVVSHDTGPLHLAGLSQTCLVGIFGPTDPATRLPRRPHTAALWGGRAYACRPCYDDHGFAPCHFNGCMHEITSAEVIRQLELLLAERGVS